MTFYQKLLVGLLFLISSLAWADNPETRQKVNDIFIVETDDTTSNLKLITPPTSIALREDQNFNMVIMSIENQEHELVTFGVNGEGPGGFTVNFVVGTDANHACAIEIIDDTSLDEVNIKSDCNNNLKVNMDINDGNYHLHVYK